MAQMREIKGRMKAIGNIQRITKTMQLIATARFQAALRHATASQPYSQKIAELVGELATTCATSDTDGLSHPLLRAATPPNKQLLLVITSNRGLCGGYNASVLRTAIAYRNENDPKAIEIEVVGNKGTGYFRFVKIPVSASHTEFGESPTFEQVDALAQKYMQGFIAEQYDIVSVAYMSFQTVARQTPKVQTLLPLQNPVSEADRNSAQATAAIDYDFSPDPQVLLDELLPVTVKTQLYQCINEAILGEHIARMVAMKNATDSAGKMGKELTRMYNRARQTAITTELSEIIGGAAALE